MDDILSAALGQSGLNLSFLETHDQTSDNNGIKTVNTDDGGDEDVTDLLNLLDSGTPGHSGGNNEISNNMLDMVFNYKSDEENHSDIPSPQPQNLSIIETVRQNNSVLTSNSMQLSQLHRNKNSIMQCFSPASVMLNRLAMPAKSESKISTHRNQPIKVCQTLTSGHQQTFNSNFLNDTKVDNGAIVDIEKRKQSIQHVLASPNLTVREKQFLMKSALSHQMIPELSPNTAKMSPKSISSSKTAAAATHDYDDDGSEENEMTHTDTFAEYMPSKVKIGKRHPDPVVETSSMASVTPPDVWYNLLLPQDVIQQGALSALQLESIIYASQQHEKLLPNGKRAGFLIGDGAGVGKGRTIAGVIHENYLHGRKKAIWLSVSNDLRYDALRDLRDIGCHIKVVPLNKFKYDEKITSKANGKFKKGCVFATYSALISETSSKAKFSSRLEQLVHWFGKDYDGVIVLDECHKAKNLMPIGSTRPTKTGLTVLKLQDQLPKARVVYCSATGASEPKNMAYMNRLGLWGAGTPFKEFTDFLMSIEKRGVGAMEMVAMDMKLRGMYMARQLSFTGVTFDINEVKLAESFIEMYDAAVKLWVDARTKFEEAADLVGLDKKGKKSMWGQFWSSHQRFFKYLCIAAKVKHAVNLAKEAIRLGKCVIFGLQSTGEARISDQIDDMGGELYDFISTTKGVFSILVEKHFPTRENPNNLNMDRTEERKRKRVERQEKLLKRRKGDAVVNSLITDDWGDSDSDSNESSKNDPEFLNSEEESDDSIDRNPFEDGESGSDVSDDEEEWLSVLSDKKYDNAEKNLRNKAKKEDISDSSANALAAAGISVGRQYSWANSPSTKPEVKERKAAGAPQKLEHQLSAISVIAQPSGKCDPQKICSCMKENLLEQLEMIGPYLPPNTLDELIDELGGPDLVAEMTGRKSRVIAKDDGSFVYEPRSKDDVPLEILNVAEKKRFMNEEKLIAVISEAASSGISLQADRRAKNQRRRVHITLELPWSADKAIQQFGRSHRSNQVSAPEYLFLISELAGEQRFASIVAKRLESLGALTHGDRRSNESRDFSRYNFDTRYGRQALDTVLKSVIGLEKPLVSLRSKYTESFLKVMRDSLVGIGLIQKDDRTGAFSLVDKDYTNIPRFLNRILGMAVLLQNSLFQYFTDTLATIIKEAKRSGRWDEGIVDLGAHGETVEQTDRKIFSCPATCGQVTTQLTTVSIERGLSFSKALFMQKQSEDVCEGFYLSSQLRNGRKTAVLILREFSSKRKLFSIYRPNIGLVQKQENWEEINKKYVKSLPCDVEETWKEQYDYSENNCVHAFWRGYCKKKIVGLPCEIGTRKRTCHILCGSVLSVWSKVESVLSCQPGPVSKMQIIRCKLDNGHKIVGLLIPSNCLDHLVKVLSGSEIF